jgi:hypothetical protein
MRAPKQQPTAEQLAALQVWAQHYGARWKSALREAWMVAGGRFAYYQPALQQVRNQFGPSWLERYKLPQQ